MDKLAAFSYSKSYGPGEVIIEEGRTGNGVYAITSGQVEVVKGLNPHFPYQLHREYRNQQQNYLM